MKAYLGDGAYVETGRYAGEIVLTTEDGISVQNTVVLGPGEWAALVRFVSASKGRVREAEIEEEGRDAS